MTNTHEKCIYCGKYAETTNDHVPSPQMFPRPLPDDLITVPACRECNAGFQSDEDYLRGLFLVMGAIPQSEFSDFYQRCVRGLERSPGLKLTIENSLKNGNLVNTSEEIIGKWMNVVDHWDRINNMFNKYVRGLYYHEMNIPLPPLTVIDCPHFDDAPVPLGHLYSITQDGKDSWDGIFRYKYHVSEDDPEESSWIFTFYDTNVYCAFSNNRNE